MNILDSIRRLPCDHLVGAMTMALICAAIAAALFFNGQHINIYAAAGICSFAALIVAVAGRRSIPLPVGAVGIILMAYAVWEGLAIAWSQVPYMSVIELGTTGAALAIYATWRLYNTGSRPLPTAFFLLAFGLAFAVIMLAQWAAGLRPRAMLLNPNSAAGFVNFLWPAAAIGWLGVHRLPRHRWFCLLAAFLMLTALGLDGSRGALLGALAALLVVGFTGIHILRRPHATGAVAVAFIAAFVLANFLGSGAAGAGIASMSDPGLAGASRWTIWEATLEMIRQRPWLGFGPGAFWLAYPAYRQAADGSAGLFAHNDYLEFWVESGLPGLLLVIAIGLACGYLFLRAIQGYRAQVVERGALELATLSFAGLVGVATHSVVTFNLQMIPFLLLCAILIAELERASPVSPVIRVTLFPKALRPLPAISIVLLACIPFVHFTRTATAFAYIERGSELTARGQYVEAAEALSTSRAIWAQPDAPWYLHANVLFEALRNNESATPEHRRELINRAFALLDEAERRNPLRARPSLVRGLFQANHPEIATGNAESSLEKALHLDPRNVEARYALSQILTRDGRIQAALTLIENGLELTFSRGTDTTPLHRRARLLQDRLRSGERPQDNRRELPAAPTDGRFE